ncbi:MAG: SRPBCC family protein [Bdellovibrionota bacterium]
MLFMLRATQKITLSPGSTWEFFSNPNNLSELVPSSLHFEVLHNPPSKIHSGMILTYTVAPVLRIPWTWVTEISHVVERQYFVDDQRAGPYRMWHHQHLFHADGSGTVVEDVVHYSLFAPGVESLVNRLVVRPRVTEIFRYRGQRMSELFGGSEQRLTVS